MKGCIANTSQHWLSAINLSRRSFAIVIIFWLVFLMSYRAMSANWSVNVYSGVQVQSHMIASDQWEGSPQGVAYSEFNHALAGVGVTLVGLAEFHSAMGWTALVWVQWLVPVALIGSGIFLLIWSDHAAWPIGSWTLIDTFFGNDPEVLQHKIFGILALVVGIVEWLGRAEKVRQRFWQALLPSFALLGSFMLFSHMHGQHPAGHHIQLHHNMMGTFALIGGLAWFAGEWLHRSAPAAISLSSQESRSAFKILWAGAVFTIGIQLLFYSES